MEWRVKPKEMKSSYSILFVCNVCRQTFTTKKNLDEHFETHQAGCWQCGKTFANKSNLNRHISLAHPTKNYDCEECPGNVKFASWSKLMAHLKKEHFHLDSPKTSTSYNNALKCRYCGIQYRAASALDYHLKNAHSSRPFKCLQCCCSFGTPRGLTHHKNRHHRHTTCKK